MERLILVMILVASTCYGELIGEKLPSVGRVSRAESLLFTESGDIVLQNAKLFKDKFVFTSSEQEVKLFVFLLFDGEIFLGSTAIRGVSGEEVEELEDLKEAYVVSEEEVRLTVEELANLYPIDELVSLREESNLIKQQVLSIDVPDNWYEALKTVPTEAVDFAPLEDALVKLTRVSSLKAREHRRRNSASRVSRQTKLAIINKYSGYDTETLKAELSKFNKQRELDF